MGAKHKRSNKKQGTITVIVAFAVIVGIYYYASCGTSEIGSAKAQEKTDRYSLDTTSLDISFDTSGVELPYFESEEFIIYSRDGGYTLLYDTLYRQAAWVAYILTNEDVTAKRVKRHDRFLPDPQVVERGYPYARTSAYSGSGYDRGHLCPSADRTAEQTANDCTFLLSNISPQRPALNRGVWKNLEEQIRRWATRYDTVYVVTGGVLSGNLKRIGQGVGVPEIFYKAVMTRIGGELHSIGFLIPNTDNYPCGYEDYAVSIDSLESVAHLDMFHSLPDNLEVTIESSTDYSIWFE